MRVLSPNWSRTHDHVLTARSMGLGSRRSNERGHSCTQGAVGEELLPRNCTISGIGFSSNLALFPFDSPSLSTVLLSALAKKNAEARELSFLGMLGGIPESRRSSGCLNSSTWCCCEGVPLPSTPLASLLSYLLYSYLGHVNSVHVSTSK